MSPRSVPIHFLPADPLAIPCSVLSPALPSEVPPPPSPFSPRRKNPRSQIYFDPPPTGTKRSPFGAPTHCA